MMSINRFPQTFAILYNRHKVKYKKVVCATAASIFSFSGNSKYHSRVLLISDVRNSCPLLINRTNAQTIEHYRSMSKSSNVSVVDERTQKALENDEFRDLLKDFAKDFEVSEDSAKILEDIKKDQQGEERPPLDKRRVTIEEKDCTGSDAESTVAAYLSLTKDKFKVFKDEDSTVIYSVEEEAHLELDDDFFHIEQESTESKASAKRGVTGVYDIHELVAILREENLMDIAVIRIPDSFHYTDYMVLANAKSPKHARAVSEYIVQFYKKKKSKRDPFVKIEGEKYGSWNAIDMGNIVLHIFLGDTRACYDIESLWLHDNKYDSGGELQQDEFSEIMQAELEFFNCLQSSETNTQDSNFEIPK